MTKVKKQLLGILLLTIFLLGNFGQDIFVFAKGNEETKCRRCSLKFREEEEEEEEKPTTDRVSYINSGAALEAISEDKETTKATPAPTQKKVKAEDVVETSPPPIEQTSAKVTEAPAPIATEAAPVPVAPEYTDLAKSLPKTGENRLPAVLGALSLLSLSAAAFVVRRNLSK